jgi:RNA polymerase sigma factor (sigma-70 family)
MAGGFTSLIQDAKQGDPVALSRLYSEYVAGVLPEVSGRLRGTLRRGYDTLDLGHSVFLEILRDLPHFEDRGEAAFRNWVAIKARSKIRGKLRKILRSQGGRREVTFAPGMVAGPFAKEPGPLSRTMRDEEDARLFGALETLKTSHRMVLLLRNEDALAFAEVARCLGLPSADAARKLYARALVSLRNQWRRA